MLMRKPQLIVVGGHPGVGKSTLANGLAEKLGWPVLSMDTVVKGIRDTLEISREKSLDVAVSVVLQQAEQSVGNTNRVIVDMSLNLKPEWERFLLLKDRNPMVKFLPLFLLADFDTCEARVVERVRANPDDPRAPYERDLFLADFESYVDYDFRGLIKMEARRPKQDILKNAVALIYANLLT